MNRIYQAFLVITLIFSFSEKSQARHIIGGEMTYVCIGEDPNNPGSNLYFVTMKVYRDCFGGGAAFDSAPGGTTGTVSVYRDSANVQELFINTIILQAPEINTIDPSMVNNPCLLIPSNVCVQEGIYTFNVSLPVSQNHSYHLVYQRCCRNQTITNIVNPGAAGSTYTVEITPTGQNECNSSPVFNTFPPPVICVDAPMSIDLSATDADGDQLVYKFCSPLLGGTMMNVAPNPDSPPPFNEVQFNLPNYSVLNPLGATANLAIDANTGIITGWPLIQGQFVVGVCVEEFRNGELLSVVQRDFQFNVAFCEPSVVADTDGVDAGDKIKYYSCVDSAFTFINESTDELFIEEYLWEFDIPGQNPLSFSERDITITFPGPGIYNGIMALNPGTECSDTAFIEVVITPPIVSGFSAEYDTCVAGPVDFVDETNLSEITISDWRWTTNDSTFSTERNTSFQFETPGHKEVKLVVTDSIGCKDSTIHIVEWYPAPPLIIVEPSSFKGCPPAEISFVNLSEPIDSTYNIVWDFGDGGEAFEVSPNHIFETPGLFDISVEITSPIGCFVSRLFEEWIFIDSFTVADFSFTPDRGSNFEPTITFTNLSEHAVGWEWTFDKHGSTIIKDPVFTFPDTGSMEVRLIAEHFYNCKDTIIKTIDIVPEITFFMPNAFTPNNDSKNEVFEPVGVFRGIRDYEMKVIDRWGGIAFETNNPEQGWNGRKNNVGQFLAAGVYVYIIRFTGPRGEPREYKGFATLIR